MNKLHFYKTNLSRFYKKCVSKIFCLTACVCALLLWNCTEVPDACSSDYPRPENTNTHFCAGGREIPKTNGQNCNAAHGIPCVVATVPSTPTSVTAIATSSSSIVVSWNMALGASGYYVYRSTSVNGIFAQVGSPTSTSFIDVGLSASTTYFYRVAAYNLVGTGTQSLPTSATTIANVWDGMSCNRTGVCVAITNQLEWDACPLNRFPTLTCTAGSSCTAGVDCESDIGSCTANGICRDNFTRASCPANGTFSANQTCPILTFFCPTACVQDQGTSRPSSCYATLSACQQASTPSCTPGRDCGDDIGRCTLANGTCTNGVRRDRCSGAFVYNSTCQTSGGGDEYCLYVGADPGEVPQSRCIDISEYGEPHCTQFGGYPLRNAAARYNDLASCENVARNIVMQFCDYGPSSLSTRPDAQPGELDGGCWTIRTSGLDSDLSNCNSYGTIVSSCHCNFVGHYDNTTSCNHLGDTGGGDDEREYCLWVGGGPNGESSCGPISTQTEINNCNQYGGYLLGSINIQGRYTSLSDCQDGLNSLPTIQYCHYVSNRECWPIVSEYTNTGCRNGGGDVVSTCPHGVGVY